MLTIGHCLLTAEDKNLSANADENGNVIRLLIQKRASLIIISPVLRQLHWLPVRQRLVFKVATLVYQSLSDDCQLVTDVRVRQMRSADTRTLAVNRTSSSFGDRTFATVEQFAARPETTGTVVYGQFRRSLKTFFFGQRDHGTV